MHVRCPAKINLDLRVGPARPDGFHSIRSWFVTVGLYDTLTLAPADDVSLACDDPALSCAPDNLVRRAAEALLAGRRPPRGVAMTLAKRIPAGGGLGGGSSDAAATLVALNAFWGLGRSREDLAAVAATLGSDVSFFLSPPSAICRGRGERVEPVPPPGSRWAVLILPGVHLSTPAVFRRLDELRPNADFDDTFVRPEAESAAALMERSVNDLEPAAWSLRPDLRTLRDAASRSLARPVRLSGSGSTLFTLYDAQDDARAAARLLEISHGVGAIAVPVAPAADHALA